MYKPIEMIERSYFALKNIACDLASGENITEEDKSGLFTALKGCLLLLMILKDIAPDLYPEQKKDFDSTIKEIKKRFKPSEYSFTGSLKSFFDE